MADAAASLSTLSTLFKVLYGKRTYAVFNTATPLWSKVKKEYSSFKGKSLSLEAVLGFSGSVGSGSLPETNIFSDVNASLTRKKLYARILLDREAMIASNGVEHAFEQATKRMVKKGVESFMRNLSRMLFAIENGKLFEGDNSTVVTGAGTSGSPYLVIGLSTTWVRSFVELKDKVNVGTETTVLEITAVNYSTRQVSLVGTSATLAAAVAGGLATSAKVYMQGSKDNDIQSILAACKATSSTLYGVTVGSRWQSVQIDAASAGITTDLINQLVTDVEFASGESPDLLVTSYKQYRKIQNLLGDKIRYCPVSNRDPIFNKATFNFEGIEWITNSGPVTIVADRMCPDDHFFALNTDNIVFYAAEAPKWADEDGTVLLRSASADAYEARYICYGELFCHPASQGVLYGLA
jgi:hypothetical protein